MYVLYVSQNKQRPFPSTALTELFLQPRHYVHCAVRAESLCIILVVFKILIRRRPKNDNGDWYCSSSLGAWLAIYPDTLFSPGTDVRLSGPCFASRNTSFLPEQVPRNYPMSKLRKVTLAVTNSMEQIPS